MDDIFRSETSHLVWNNGTLNIYLHIPAYKIDSRLQLLEHIPVPLILPELVDQSSLGKEYRNTAMFVQPLHTILAIQTGGSALVIDRKWIYLFRPKTNIWQENAAEYSANNKYSAQGRKHQKNVNLIWKTNCFLRWQLQVAVVKA
jgi:hypothetical protein